MKTVTRSQSIAKTISWRVAATLTTGLLVFFFTGDFTIAIQVGGLEVILKLLFYYYDERGWSRITWGTYYKN